MKNIVKFLKDRRGVSPVIGVILMVAITVVMAAVIGGWVYGFGMPMKVPTMAATLADDARVTLTAEVVNGRVAKLTILAGPNIAKSELQCVVTYTYYGAEYTKTLDGTSWLVAGTAYPMGATPTINLTWVDSDGSGDISPSDRLDFTERATLTGNEVGANTDFTVKVIHKGSESVLVSQTIKVY